ncbi:two-component system OmpR family sensor kinase [Paucibacter oligotrophus]|uniref:histidine kinase n=1 Tax=Roseateles oligotrophus TaxID=1769250 RepID=A0A840LEB8_9BURK|nr:ATP-binding protein [Roseateles oligotrophus]MBB4844982.1 two-component system OmpR family sensor kinase [Roseateles oligotrophus]
MSKKALFELEGLPRSLRNRLIVFLLAGMSLAGLVQGLSAYHTALHEADQIFDYQMQQMAISLRGGVGRGTVSLPLAQDQSFDFLVQVWGVDGASLFRSPGELLLPQQALLGFTELSQGGKRFRVFSLQTPYQLVQVAQDLAVRQRMAGQLAWRTVLPIALMWPFLALLVWWVVGQALAPVQRISAQLTQRGADDLAPLPAQDLPSELQPLLQAFNKLLGRVSQAFAAQQSFVANAAHELRSPLAALSLQWQGLKRAGSDEAARALAQERLGQGIARASRLTEQMLQLARQEAQGQGPAMQAVDLAALCREAVVEASVAAEQAGGDLGLSHADEIQIQGRPEALRVLMRNLLDNAIKYSPPGGRVDLSLQRDGGLALLRVEDGGPGIPPEQRERVFERFYRGDSHEPVQGSGLGLAIVQSIARAHGATIGLAQSAQLGGLRLEVKFPLA